VLRREWAKANVRLAAVFIASAWFIMVTVFLTW
jgi:hypothetical protein